MAISKGKQSQQAKAKITLSVSRVTKLMRRSNVSKCVSSRSPIFVAGVVEAMLKSVLAKSIQHAQNNKGKRLNNIDVIAAVRTDPDLARLFGGFTFSSVAPASKAINHILPADEQKERRDLIRANKLKAHNKRELAKAEAEAEAEGGEAPIVAGALVD